MKSDPLSRNTFTMKLQHIENMQFLHFLQASGCFSCTTLFQLYQVPLRKVSSKGKKTGHYLAVY